MVELSLEVGEVLPVELGDGAPSTQSLDHIVKLQEGSHSGPTMWSTLSVLHPWLPGNPESKPHFLPLKMGTQVVPGEISAQIIWTQVLGCSHYHALPTGTANGETEKGRIGDVRRGG